MTADLVAELRGIIAAKPPRVTVLADNAEVYPIRGALLTEVADRLAAAERALELLLAPWELERMSEADAAIAAWRETQKAYSDKACDECGGSGFVEGAWGASGEGAPCPRGCKATDLNFSKPAKEGDRG